ncbi:topoisomerase II associated protein [Histoplasma capsulatum]|uniref:Topoisomerase II associated protein n=1 Tax=Ajellomyces capsulatus TaxID=5037 RepID=A0A8A1M226_AJECA|nr:topoisomerase II associated protein [Histoplasma capsulatum]
MSFFGFDTTLPRDRPSGQQTRGIFENPDPFAHVAHAVVQDDEEAIDFEDTYDGLGDQLDEDQDAFNDDTFGGGADENTLRVNQNQNLQLALPPSLRGLVTSSIKTLAISLRFRRSQPFGGRVWGKNQRQKMIPNLSNLLHQRRR